MTKGASMHAGTISTRLGLESVPTFTSICAGPTGALSGDVVR
jgi:hypothetical protein